MGKSQLNKIKVMNEAHGHGDEAHGPGTHRDEAHGHGDEAHGPGTHRDGAHGPGAHGDKAHGHALTGMKLRATETKLMAPAPTRMKLMATGTKLTAPAIREMKLVAPATMWTRQRPRKLKAPPTAPGMLEEKLSSLLIFDMVTVIVLFFGMRGCVLLMYLFPITFFLLPSSASGTSPQVLMGPFCMPGLV